MEKRFGRGPQKIMGEQKYQEGIKMKRAEKTKKGIVEYFNSMAVAQMYCMLGWER